MAAMKTSVATLALLAGANGLNVASNSASHSSSNAELAANPIRKVVTLLQKMAKKIEAEGEEEEKLAEKFECYCKKTKGTLQETINQAVSIGPITPEMVAEKKAELAARKEQVAKIKADKIADDKSLKDAKANREKEEAKFKKALAEDMETEKSAEDALKTLKGATSFIQKDSSSPKFLPRLLKAFDTSKRYGESEKREVAAFLQGKETSGGVEDVQAYIKDIESDAESEIVAEKDEEKKEVADYGVVKKSKNEEISAALEMMEKKMKQVGELEVEIVNMEHDMEDGAETLAANRKMLAEVTKNCEEKSADAAKRQRVRQEEQLAIADTIKMLNSDDALDLFKKTLSSPALLQTGSNAKAKTASVKALINRIKATDPKHRTSLNFLALALSGKKVDFSKVLAKIDDMVALMKQEGADEEKKKDYCNKELSDASSKEKDLGKKIEELGASIVIAEDSTKKLEGEINALNAGVKELDESVTEASENRKAEHAEYEELVASNNGAIKLLGMAKNRLNQFYGGSLANSFLQVSVEQEPEMKKGEYGGQAQQGNSVLAMIAELGAELQKEITEAQTEEKNAQKEYEETVAEAADKREKDLKNAASKAKAKAETEGDMVENKDEKKGKQMKLMETEKYTASLHGECDWLLKNYDLRKDARNQEQESLVSAKATLATIQ
eukprot:TRINITY_DN6459_c0_g2_i1.p1 TRINITY_DN6459_c0_g2~~TRINITY_DN6459_c0_g2_i1.p1  ORF type:complete len:672 (-),score=264.76 TRINITY_DN6459_c0_g2_i1:47-2062(-)